MGEQRRKYDEEFKRNAVELCHTSDKTASQIARDLGINSSMRNRWRREQEKYGERAFPGLGKQMRGTDLEEENRRLKKELAIIQEERDCRCKIEWGCCQRPQKPMPMNQILQKRKRKTQEKVW